MISNIFVVLISVFISLSGCKKEDEYVIPDVPPGDEDTIAQYGEPFNKVPATEDIIMYEVNPRVFSQRGDLAGVQDRLDKLQQLGVNVVWLMPIYPIGDENSVGSPYAVKDYTAIHEEYGTLENLRKLVDEAHDRDMAVILDWVANRTAWAHEWIEDKSYYEQDAEGNITYPEDWQDVAELNFDNSDMRQEMIAAMKYWMLEANVDGFRCDYADGVPVDFWSQAIDTLKSMPDRDVIMFAEGTKKAHFDAGFELTFGWDFYNKLKDVYNQNISVTNLENVNVSDYQNVPPGSHILRFTTNHDFNAWEATPQEIFNGLDASVTAFAVTAYMGGVPMFYNGQEVGYPNQLPFFEGASITIDWAINPDILEEYTRLVEGRKNSEALKNGSLEVLSSHQDVLVFKRVSGAEQVLFIANVRGSAIDYPLPESVSNTSWTNVMEDADVDLGSNLQLAAHQYVIVKNF